MSDSEIIWKFLEKEYSNDHVIIYLYVCGSIQNKKNAVLTAINSIKLIFSNTINEAIVKSTVEGFLNLKAKLYKNGKITVKSIY
jgi:hypothetical protein